MVFVSSDRDQKSFDAYFAEMTGFHALPFANRDLKSTLSALYGVSGIPTLVFIDSSGTLITTGGRGAITAPTFIEDFPSPPKPMYDLSISTEGIQEQPSLVILCESTPTTDTIDAALTAVAIAEKANPTGKVGKFFTGKGGGPVNKVRQMCGLSDLCAAHEHPVISNAKAAEDGLALRQYPGGGNWQCDGCGNSGSAEEDRFRCAQGCDFDHCTSCHEKSSQGPSDDDAIPKMVILDISGGGVYFVPSEEHGEVTQANIELFVKEHGEGVLESTAFH